MALVALVVIAVLGAQLLLAPARSGVTIDEPTQLDRTQTWLAEGWYVPNALLVDGEPSGDPLGSPFVYGPAFAAIAHAANVAAGNEPRGSVEAGPEDWAVRHLVVAVIGLLTAGLVGMAVWAMTGSRLIALWSAAALLAIPIWTGMSFFNVKDVPAAAGYTAFTTGLVLAWRGVEGRKGATLVGALVASGVVLAVGTRIALWAALLASLCTFGLLVWARRRALGGRGGGAGVSAIGIGLAIGCAILVALYPAAVTRPLDLLGESVSVSSDYPYQGFTLTAGHLLPQKPPVWYLPAWLFASTPVLLFGTAICGLAATIAAMASSGSGRLARALERPQAAGVLVVQQLVLLTTASVIGGATMYTGVRQFLFTVPAICTLAGLGAAWLWTKVDGSASLLRRGVVVALLAGALAVPTAEQSLLFPYNYTYVNPIAGLGGINGNWETDYWASSLREALSRIPASEEPMCGGVLSPGSRQAAAEFGPCTFAPLIAPYLDERAGVRTPGDPRPWVIGNRRAGNAPAPTCEQVDDVTRWVRGEDVVMSYVLRCEDDGNTR